MEKPTKKHYSFEIKKEAVDRFLAGETHMDLAKECKLSSPKQVKDWVSKWRTGGDEALRPKPKGRSKGSARPALLTLRKTDFAVKTRNFGRKMPT
ncbi:helix-turn-helix domain-containing protein [Corynebacterium belfantii]|nr:helix-turn-helix domain-containing protein [Corynebacterium belfantii]